MAYIIKKTNGDQFAEVADGTINTQSSQVIVGKNYAGYGQFMGENFIRLLENGANGTSPTGVLPGQLWFHTVEKNLKVWTGTDYKTLSSVLASDLITSPQNPTIGDMWYIKDLKQLKVYTGELAPNDWLLIGPAFVPGNGISGSVVDQILDDSAQTRTIIKLIVEDEVVGVISNTTFTPASNAIPNITEITAGITLASTLNNISGSPLFEGTARNALNLVDLNGVERSFLEANGSVPISGNLVPDGNSTRILGADTLRFNVVYADTFNGTSTKAKYADLAERFEIDKSQPAGTVVELGGEKEVTTSLEEFSDNVFGVISTQAAYLMNSEAGEDNTHPPIAMNGRVPVRVVGKIRKGDRLVSAGNGLAQAAKSSELTAFNVIGRSLENKDSDGEGVVEAIVRIN